MLHLRSVPVEPKTIPTSLLPWLRANAPHLERTLRKLPHGETLIVPHTLLYRSPDSIWTPMANGKQCAVGWVLARDAAVRIKLVGQSHGRLGWEYLHRPAFALSDLSRADDLKVNATDELTFLIGEAAYTFIRHADEGGDLVEVDVVRAE